VIRGSFFTNDGELIFVRDPEDLTRVVQRRVGYEAAAMVRELADKATREAQITETDLRSYEAELDELHSAIRDFEDVPQKLDALAQKDRLSAADRKEIRRLAEMLRGLLSLT